MPPEEVVQKTEPVVPPSTTPEQAPSKDTVEKPMSDAIRAALLGITEPAKAPDKPAEKPAEKPTETTAVAPKVETQAKEVEAPKEEPKPKAPKKIIKAPQQPIGDVVTAAATQAAVAAVNAMNRNQPAPVVPEPELPKDIQRKLETYRELEAVDPKYKGLAEKVVEFSKTGGIEDQYIAAWKKDNPGKKFDHEAEEHEEFYSANAPNYDEDDFEVAREAVITRRVEQKVTQSLAPERERLEQAKRTEQIAPEIDLAKNRVLAGALEIIDPELLKAAQEKGDAGVSEINPLALQVVEEVAGEFDPIIEVTANLFGRVTKFEDSNPLHAQVHDVADKLESAISGIDPDQSLKPVVKGGKVIGYQKFTTHAEWRQMTPAQRQQHWVIGKDEVLMHFESLAKKRAKSRYDSILGAAQKAIGAKTGQARPAKQTEQPPATPTVSTPPEESVTVSSSMTASTPSPTAGNSKSEKGAEVFKMWGWA
jgi:hypothetical protein